MLTFVLFFLPVVTLQVHKRLHLPPPATLPRERVLPGLCSLLVPNEVAQEPTQNSFGQELANATSRPHRGEISVMNQSSVQSWTPLDLS